MLRASTDTSHASNVVMTVFIRYLLGLIVYKLCVGFFGMRPKNGIWLYTMAIYVINVNYPNYRLMTQTKSVTLTDDQVRYVDETCMNLSKFVRKAIEQEVLKGNSFVLEAFTDIMELTSGGEKFSMKEVGAPVFKRFLDRSGISMEDMRKVIAEQGFTEEMSAEVETMMLEIANA